MLAVAELVNPVLKVLDGGERNTNAKDMEPGPSISNIYKKTIIIK